jgi:hypothetical protein
MTPYILFVSNNTPYGGVVSDKKFFFKVLVRRWVSNPDFYGYHAGLKNAICQMATNSEFEGYLGHPGNCVGGLN